MKIHQLIAPALAALLMHSIPATAATDPADLPELGRDWEETNPYRGNAQAIAAGDAVYHEHCARCHGEGVSPRSPAANLRRVHGYCKRIADESVRAHCFRDNDAFFLESVEEGKVKVGVMHMPPWKDVLSPKAIRAIQAYVESVADAPAGDVE